MKIKRLFAVTLLLSFTLSILYGQKGSKYGISFYNDNGSLAKNQRAYFKEYLTSLENISRDNGKDTLGYLPLLSSDRYDQTFVTGLYKVESILSIRNNYYMNRGLLLKKHIYLVELFSMDSNPAIPYHVYVLSPKDNYPKGIRLEIGNTYQFDLKQIWGIDYGNLTSSNTPVGTDKTYEHCLYRNYYIKSIPLQNRIYFESTNLNGIYYLP